MSDRKIAKELETTSEPYPYNADQIAWLHDLETTEEPQTIGALYITRQGLGPNEKYGFCCLGRACVVLGATGQQGISRMLYEGYADVVPNSIKERLRLRGPNGHLAHFVKIHGREYSTLASMNDQGMTFKEIAAYIRANPWNVFYA